MAITVQDLIDHLNELVEDGYADAEVRLMMQPSYPMEYSIGGSIGSEEIGTDEEDEGLSIVWLCEGKQLGYGRYIAFERMEDIE